MPHDPFQATKLTIQLSEDGRVSLTAHGHSDAPMRDSLNAEDETPLPAIVDDSAVFQGVPSSMHDMASRLLTALQAEGYGDHVTVTGLASGTASYDQDA